MLEELFKGAKTKVVFLHLPKTAGTSFVNFLNDQYKPGEMLHKYKEILSADDLSGITKAVVGHLPFNWLNLDVHQCKQQGWKFISFVRNPVDRCISSYLAVKNSDRKEHKVKFNSWNRSFEGFLDAPHSYNWQCQFFSGFKLNPDISKTPQLLLEKAILNIHKMDFVGRTENFESELKYLCKTYNWKAKQVYLSNVGGDKREAVELKEKYSERLEERSALDFELIKVIEEKFGSTS